MKIDNFIGNYIQQNGGNVMKGQPSNAFVGAS